MSRYIVDILGVGSSRHDISKRQVIEGKIRKISVNIGDISSIYRLWPDILKSKSVKVAAM